MIVNIYKFLKAVFCTSECIIESFNHFCNGNQTCYSSDYLFFKKHLKLLLVRQKWIIIQKLSKIFKFK